MSSQNDTEVNSDLEEDESVCMEDVQSSDRSSEVIAETEIETCIVEGDCEEFLDDDDSNIGSMVSIRSEEVDESGEDNTELIIPEVLDATRPQNDPLIATPEKDKNMSAKTSLPESWPTLEILPGGVINADKRPCTKENEETNASEMMYACAKCSQSFNYLFSLVKHVKTHEDQDKKTRQCDLKELSLLERDYIVLKRKRIGMDQKHKKRKLELFHRIAKSLEDGDIDFFT